MTHTGHIRHIYSRCLEAVTLFRKVIPTLSGVSARFYWVTRCRPSPVSQFTIGQGIHTALSNSSQRTETLPKVRCGQKNPVEYFYPTGDAQSALAGPRDKKSLFARLITHHFLTFADFNVSKNGYLFNIIN